MNIYLSPSTSAPVVGARGVLIGGVFIPTFAPVLEDIQTGLIFCLDDSQTLAGGDTWTDSASGIKFVLPPNASVVDGVLAMSPAVGPMWATEPASILSATTFTFAAWLKTLPGNVDNACVFGYNAAYQSTHGYFMTTQSSGGVSFQTKSGDSGNYSGTGAPPALNTRRLIVCTCVAGGELKCYVDGVYSNTGSNSATLSFSGVPTPVFGGNADGFWSIPTCEISGVRIYDRILTDAQIAALYAVGGWRKEQ